MNFPPHIKQKIAQIMLAAPTHERRAYAVAIMAAIDIARQIHQNPQAIIADPSKAEDCSNAVNATVAQHVKGWTHEQLVELAAKDISAKVVNGIVPLLSIFQQVGGDPRELMQQLELITAEIIKEK